VFFGGAGGVLCGGDGSGVLFFASFEPLLHLGGGGADGAGVVALALRAHLFTDALMLKRWIHDGCDKSRGSFFCLLLGGTGLLLFLGGCNILAFPAYVLFGKTEKTVEAEYTSLSGHKTAILVVGPAGIDFEYPYARADLSMATSSFIEQNVESVDFVEQESIDRFQYQHFDWYALPLPTVAHQLGADRLLYIELIQFSLVEPESVSLLRGRVLANVRIFEMESSEPAEASYKTEISVLFPETAPVPMSDTAQIAVRQRSIVLFADQLAKRFYRHKEPAK